MDRRTLFTASVAVIGSTVTGCLENRGLVGGSDDSRESTDPTGTATSDSADGGESETTKEGTDTTDSEGRTTTTEDTPMAIETQFEVLNVDIHSLDESVAVTVEDTTVTVTGTIVGANTCYTARLAAVKMEDQTLRVAIESYEDADEDDGCFHAEVGIEYEAIIEIPGDLPASVRVEHNSEHVTTEQPP